jgi:predicted NUDIX family NTP pyrophosphohydrolase
MPLYSSGLLLFRFRNRNSQLQVLLVHPGGPFWAKKDEGAWSIPKGLIDEDESQLAAARREFQEETGFSADGKFIDLGELRQPSRKIIHAFALEKDLDETEAVSNKFSMEWPKDSGIVMEYPEIDRAGWFDITLARKKILKGQAAFLDRLIEVLNCREEPDRLSNCRQGKREDGQGLRIWRSASQSQLNRWFEE